MNLKIKSCNDPLYYFFNFDTFSPFIVFLQLPQVICDLLDQTVQLLGSLFGF